MTEPRRSLWRAFLAGVGSVLGLCPAWPPAPAGDADGVLTLIEALRRRGVYVSLHAHKGHYACELWGDDGERLVNRDFTGDTPLAAVNAAGRWAQTVGLPPTSPSAPGDRP